MQIADKEVGRKAEVERTLNFMYQQLEQLEILDTLGGPIVPPRWQPFDSKGSAPVLVCHAVHPL